MKDKKQVKNKKVEGSLKHGLIGMVVFCWTIPVLVVFVIISISYQNGIKTKTETLLKDELRNFATFTSYKIDEAIAISRNTSYENRVENKWRAYETGKAERTDLYNIAKEEIKGRYYKDSRFDLAVMYIHGEEEAICYSSRKKGGYKEYRENEEKIVLETVKGNVSRSQVKVINNKLYVVRNLYTTIGYNKYGILVLELNISKLFEDISRNKIYSVGIYINDNQEFLIDDNDFENERKKNILKKLSEEYSYDCREQENRYSDKKYEGYMYQKKYDDYHIGAVLVVNKDVVYSELNTLNEIILLMLAIMIPVLLYVIYFISRHITSPMGKLIEASRKIEKGEIGLQIDKSKMPNKEFAYVMDAYNKMSKEVKYLFDYAYNENMAKKDAKILALQSQINPHFLNNTLEMMNWQARMSGDTKVSKMIEALATLLDYSMDRSNKRVISLFEEIKCADAYLYIISMRFGKRLQVEREIDKSLMQFKVPQLIIQPLLENAVVHGVEEARNGIIKLEICRKDSDVIIRVINSGKTITEEEIKRIDVILNGETKCNDVSGGKHVSLGIRNVNERIKLIYGEGYGLTIKPLENGQTAATITIPFEHIVTEKRNELLKNMFEISKEDFDEV